MAAGARALFQAGDFASEDYCSLRDAPHNVGRKVYCESLWDRYASFADPHFIDEIRIQFHPRFWEMYLAVSLLDRGYAMHKLPGGGPEFGVDINGTRYWFEAIAPTAGDGLDAVPAEGRRHGFRAVPQEQIILRYTGALYYKRKQWQRNLSKGRVSPREGYIVAINDRSIPWGWIGSDLPYVVKGLYGFGNLEVVFDVNPTRIVETRRQHRPALKKASGSSVSSQAFIAGECPEISAVIYSLDEVANCSEEPGANFMLLHNTAPNVPVPRGVLQFRRECWVESDELRIAPAEGW
jgi:hypothetical protein